MLTDRGTAVFPSLPYSARSQAVVSVEWRDIRPAMEECMEQAREDRIAHIYMEKLSGRWDAIIATLRTLLHRPEACAYDVGIGEIALMPEIREVADAPPDVLIDEASFAEVHEKFGEMIERWKQNAEEQLRELVMQSRPKVKGTRKGKAKAVQPGADVLELATTRFHCDECNGRSMALYYPGVLAHECLRGSPRSESDDLYQRYVYGKLIMSPPGMAMLCHLDKLTVAQPSEAAKNVIKLCGKDPETATVGEMNALNVMLVHGGEIRTWRNAVCPSPALRSSLLTRPGRTPDTLRRHQREGDQVAVGESRRNRCDEVTHASHAEGTDRLFLRVV